MEGRDGFLGVVNAAQPGELGVVEALHAHAQPVDAHAGQHGEVRLVHRARIGLAGDLGIRRDIERLPTRVKHVRQERRRQHGRRPPPR